MNIVIDARAVTSSKTGVGNYIVHLSAVLSRLDNKNRFVVLHSRFRHWIKSVSLWSVIFRVIIFCYDNLIFPFKLLIINTDIYHNPAFILPLLNFNYRKIITVHDLGFYVFGGKFAKGWHAKHMRLMLPYSMRQADKIIAVSQATKQQIIDVFKIAPEKIVVTYEGVSEKFRVIQDKVEVEKVLSKYGIKGLYILFVGTMDPRKNLIRLIEAFQEAKKKILDLKLVIVGSKGELYNEELNKLIASGNIVLPGYVEEEDLVYLYNGARIFAFPSLYEGFGLPILEAMACGAPVITSNVYSMPEIAGDAAILVNPESTDEISAAINRLLQDESFRKNLIEKGLRRAEEFTWEKTARATLAVYKEVMNSKEGCLEQR